jgi:hypothetical protein
MSCSGRFPVVPQMTAVSILLTSMGLVWRGELRHPGHHINVSWDQPGIHQGVVGTKTRRKSDWDYLDSAKTNLGITWDSPGKPLGFPGSSYQLGPGTT